MAAADLVWYGQDSGNEGDVNTAANWISKTSGEANRVPVAGDTIYFRNSSQNVTENLDQLSAVVLVAIYVESSYTGRFDDGAGGSFQHAAPKVIIGEDSAGVVGKGSGKLRFDNESVSCDYTVYKTGKAAGNDAALNIISSGGTNNLYIHSGSVGVCYGPGEAATFATIEIYNSDANVYIGDGITVTTITKYNGFLDFKDASGTITTVSNYAGDCVVRASGTITTLNVYGGYVDLRPEDGTLTLTNTNQRIGSTLEYLGSEITLTNPISHDKRVSIIGKV